MNSDKKYFIYIIAFALLTLLSIFFNIVFSQYIVSIYFFKVLFSVIIYSVFAILNFNFVKRNDAFASQKKYNILLTIGIIATALGNLTSLALYQLGMFFYAVGIVLYFISFLFYLKFNYIDILCCIGSYIATLILLYVCNGFNLGFYSVTDFMLLLVLCLMFGKAIAIFIKTPRSLKSALLISSTILFYIYYFVLFLNIGGNANTLLSTISSIVFLPSQYLLGLTILIFDDIKIIENNDLKETKEEKEKAKITRKNPSKTQATQNTVSSINTKKNSDNKSKIKLF